MRNKIYERKFKTYLFKGDAERFKQICEEIGINENIKILIKKDLKE